MAQTTQNGPPVETEKHKQSNGSSPQKFFDRAAQLSGLKARPNIKDVNQEFDSKLTLGERIADVIAEFSGSIPFLLINLAAFVTWIALNTLGPKDWHFDEYPFQFLTMAVSLEAIFLSIFVLVSQNRQADKDRIAAQNDYDVNKLGEIEIQAVLLHLEEQDRLILELMARFDRAFGGQNTPTSPYNSYDVVEEVVISHGMIASGGKKLEPFHLEKVKNDMRAAAQFHLVQTKLEPIAVRDLMGHCYAILNIESFQRNTLVEPNYTINESKLSVLRILYKEAFISIGADFDHPDAEDLDEVRDLLLKRMTARALDPHLIECYAEVSQALICKVPGANC